MLAIVRLVVVPEVWMVMLWVLASLEKRRRPDSFKKLQVTKIKIRSWNQKPWNNIQNVFTKWYIIYVHMFYNHVCLQCFANGLLLYWSKGLQIAKPINYIPKQVVPSSRTLLCISGGHAAELSERRRCGCSEERDKPFSFWNKFFSLTVW